MKKAFLLPVFLLSMCYLQAQPFPWERMSSKDSAFFAIAATPPMGWNSWNKFGCNVSEKLIKEVADAMYQSGMRDAGYQYVVIDDCWQVGRDEDGFILVDPERFPSGIKALADYIHAGSSKLDLFLRGSHTCQGRPAVAVINFRMPVNTLNGVSITPEVRLVRQPGTKCKGCL